MQNICSHIIRVIVWVTTLGVVNNFFKLSITASVKQPRSTDYENWRLCETLHDDTSENYAVAECHSSVNFCNLTRSLLNDSVQPSIRDPRSIQTSRIRVNWSFKKVYVHNIWKSSKMSLHPSVSIVIISIHWYEGNKYWWIDYDFKRSSLRSHCWKWDFLCDFQTLC